MSKEEELRKEFKKQMGFSESDQHKFYDNDGHEVDFEYFWDEYEKWKTAQLLKAREESKQHHDWYEKAVNRLSELRQELERVNRKKKLRNSVWYSFDSSNLCVSR